MKLFWFTLLTASMLCGLAIAGAPNLVNYQGRLTDGADNPIADGSYSVVFAIYNVPTSGVSLWNETQSVTTASGLFSVLLGSTILFGTTLFDDTSLYLGVKVGANPEMVPRERLISVPFARSAASGGGWQDDGTTVRLNTTTDYVGIGTSSPSRPLHVVEPSGGLFASRIESSNSGATVSEFANSSASSVWELSVAGSAGIPFWGVQPGDLYFYKQGTSWPTAVLTSTRGLGLGTSLPRARLEAVTLDTIAGLFLSGGETSATKVLRAEYTGTGLNDAVAVYGKSTPSDYYGLGGVFEGGFIGVHGSVNQNGPNSYFGAYGEADGNGTGNKYGLYGSAGGSAGVKYGVYGAADGSTGKKYGVYGYALGDAPNNAYGLYGEATGANAIGVGATAGGTGYCIGVDGTANGGGIQNIGIYGTAYGGQENWAGYFGQNVWVGGTLSKNAGAFRIDHPLDPENKYLQHSFVESPDMMNIYNGNVVTDANGNAVVVLPDYFSALNKDFRYQLTVIGQFAQAMVSEKISNNQFSIKTDKPNVEVSWQVTGVRKDVYAEAHRIEVEVNKRPNEIGKYQFPELFGKSEVLGIDYEMHRRILEREERHASAKKSDPTKKLNKPDLE